MNIPEPLRSARAWLVWRLVQKPEQKKPSKIPFYASGAARGDQGSHADRVAMVTFDEARAACARGGYSGIGFATFSDLGVVALDFDNVVVDGQVRSDVLDFVAGSYAELSPSGTGVRAFFRGTLPSRKDTKGDPSIEFFGDTGFVTVTGNVLDGHDLWGVAEITPAVKALYVQRFGEPRQANSFAGSDLMAIVPTLGWSLDEARAILMDCDSGTDRDHWVKALAALHHEMNGSDAALHLANEWSACGENYSGRADVEGRWRSFGKGRANPITGRWLLKWRDECSAHARYRHTDDWKARIAATADEFTLREKVCVEISKDLVIGELEREALAQALFDRFKLMGTKFPIGQCRKMLEARKREPMAPRRPLTEFGNTERMLDRFGAGLMYVPELSHWYAWNGVYWRVAADVEIEHCAKETIKALPSEIDDHPEPAEFFQFCAASQQARMVRNMVSLASSDPRVLVPANELDAHAHLVGTENGVVNLDTLECLSPAPAYRITKVCGAAFDPRARAPLFEQTLADVFNRDAPMIEFFQRLVGYAACGQPTEDLLVIPFGNGANGKSTVLGTIRRALGHYAKAAEAASFVTDGNSGGSAGSAREDLVRLRGARLVYVNEPDDGGELREGSVKSMAGGDAITARAPYAKASVEIVPTWVAFMPTNHLPIVKGSDNGIWRRLMPIPFERNFESDPTIVKDPRREEKLLAELPGVLAWILQGATLYKQMGLAPPDSVKRARDSYRSRMDLLAEWLDECCDIAPGYACEASLLWQSWEPFAKARGITQYIRSNIALGRKLDARFPAVKGTGGVRMRTGLRVRDPFRVLNSGLPHDLF